MLKTDHYSDGLFSSSTNVILGNDDMAGAMINTETMKEERKGVVQITDINSL